MGSVGLFFGRPASSDGVSSNMWGRKGRASADDRQRRGPSRHRATEGLDLAQHQIRAPLRRQPDVTTDLRRQRDDPRPRLGELFGPLADLSKLQAVVRELEQKRNRLSVATIAAAIDFDAIERI